MFVRTYGYAMVKFFTLRSAHMTDDITLAITGASGSPYAIRLLEQLLATGQQVNLLISKPGQIVMSMESELSLSAKTSTMQQQLASRFQLEDAEQLRVFGLEQWTAPVASGSGISRAMVVCPCTTGTLSSIATGQRTGNARAGRGDRRTTGRCYHAGKSRIL